MHRLVVGALKAVLGLSLLGSLFVQTVMVPLAWNDREDADLPNRVLLLVLVLLGIVMVQVCAVCVWKLLTMVERGTVFTPAAFRWVDVIIASIAVEALLIFAFGAAAAPGNDDSPGVILLIGGVGVLAAGVALIVLVLRILLAQAVARDAEARALQSELDEVI